MKSLKARLAFVLISKLYRQMYANTGIATDSARHARANKHGAAARQALPPLVRGGLRPRLTILTVATGVVYSNNPAVGEEPAVVD